MITYKVAILVKGKRQIYRSAIVDRLPWLQIYEVGRTTIAPMGSKLFSFKIAYDARCFVNSCITSRCVILKCECDDAQPIDMVMSETSTHRFLSFWHGEDTDHTWYFLHPPPLGTVVSKSLTIIEVVERIN